MLLPTSSIMTISPNPAKRGRHSMADNCTVRLLIGPDQETHTGFEALANHSELSAAELIRSAMKEVSEKRRERHCGPCALSTLPANPQFNGGRSLLLLRFIYVLRGWVASSMMTTSSRWLWSKIQR